jgi:hypothetical protein
MEAVSGRPKAAIGPSRFAIRPRFASSIAGAHDKPIWPVMLVHTDSAVVNASNSDRISA